MRRHLFAIFILAALPASAEAERLRIIDGDGFELAGENIRLWGIDAPELEQTCEREGVNYGCGNFARDVLESLISTDLPVCETVDTDRYNRTIARCSVGGRDLGAMMVQSGWALDFRRYSQGRYAAEENDARTAGRGLWGGEFVLPWEWRLLSR